LALFSAHRSLPTASTSAAQETPWQSLVRPRALFFAVTTALALAITAAFAGAVTHWSVFAWAALPLVLMNALWISGGAATALLGTARLFSRTGPEIAAPADRLPTGRTALLITLCGEDPEPPARYLGALARELDQNGLRSLVRLFVLSDTSDQQAIGHEEKALRQLVDSGLITYRRRSHNTDKKPGNIAEWLAVHGDAFDHMMVLDADSRMTVSRIVRMIGQIESRPGTGLVQAGIALVPGSTGFGRHQRTSSRLMARTFGQGFAAWTGRTGNYWGHNAIMRVAAFRSAAQLPKLPGKAPLGGAVLSHDFVEAAWMRRAGWAIELDPGLDGSAEDAPQTLHDFFKRDRRWCQGNLQHLLLLFEAGLHPVSRLHLASGIAGYLAAPIWLTLVALVASGAVPVAGALPFAIAAVALLIPKFCALVTAFWRARTPWRRGIVARAWTGELLLSALIAPLIMLRQAASVGAVLLGRDCGWKQPAAASKRWRAPLGTVEALIGAALLALSLAGGPAGTAWLAPLIVPMLAAPWIMARLNRPVRA
jgi:membrane glycosyltransferase